MTNVSLVKKLNAQFMFFVIIRIEKKRRGNSLFGALQLSPIFGLLIHV